MAETNQTVSEEKKVASELSLKEQIVNALGGVDNADLIEYLTEWKIVKIQFLYPLMEMKGYQFSYEQKLLTFTHKDKGSFSVSFNDLKGVFEKCETSDVVDLKLERLLNSYLECNRQLNYLVVDMTKYLPLFSRNTQKKRVYPNVVIVDKQRKLVVDHYDLYQKLVNLLQRNLITNEKYRTILNNYRQKVAEQYPEQIAELLLQGGNIREKFLEHFYMRDGFGYSFIELEEGKVLPFPYHVMRDLSLVDELEYKQPTESKAEVVAKEEPTPKPKREQATEPTPKKEVKRAKAPVPEAKEEVKPTPKQNVKEAKAESKSNNENAKQAKNSNRNDKRNNRDNYSKNYQGRNGRRPKRNQVEDQIQFRFTEEDINYLIPVGWRNTLNSWGFIGRFFLKIWIAWALAARITEQDKERK